MTKMVGCSFKLVLCASLLVACGDDAGVDDVLSSSSSDESSSQGDETPGTDDDSSGAESSSGGGADESGSSTGDTSGDPTGDDETGSTGTDGSSSDGDTTEGTDTTDDGSDSESSSSGGQEEPEVVTIYDIQGGTVEDGTLVEVLGVVVTGITEERTGMFVQEIEAGENSGLFVTIAGLEGEFGVGDVVDIVGVRNEYYDLSRIVASEVTATGSQSPAEPELLDPAVLLGPETAEPWEGVLVRIEAESLPVVEVIEEYDEFRLGLGETATVLVDDYLFDALADDDAFPTLVEGAGFTAVQGPLNYSFENFKIAPRQPGDLEGYEPGPPTPADTLGVGDVVITEVMYNPWSGDGGSDDNREWIEVLNRTDATINLRGLRVLDEGNNEGAIETDVLVEPGQYVVLAHGNGANWPYDTFTPAGFYGGATIFNNGNSGDDVELWNSTELLDAMTYRSETPDDGRSLQLDPTLLDPEDNDVEANWCLSSTEIEDVGFGVDRGSPGVVNPQSCLDPE